jgi:DnaJ-class molecular chaperone
MYFIVMDDPYKILGIYRGTSIDEVKSAYKRLARLHHPDKGGDAEVFQTVNTAYSIILKQYERPPRPPFATFFDDCMDVMNQRSGRIEVPMTLEELFTGKKVNIMGTTIYIPSGVVPYSVMLMPENQNIQIVVVVVKHRNFSLDLRSMDLTFRTSISLCEALVGYRGKIRHPNGQMLYITTPKDVVIDSTSRFRYPGLGLSLGSQDTMSALIVEFTVIIPRKIDSLRYKDTLMEIFECNVPVIIKKDDDVDVALKII